MKYKKTLIATIIYFVAIITSDFLSNNLNVFTILFYLALAILFFTLLAILIYHLFQAVKERFVNRKRIYLIIVMALVLTLTVYMPKGYLDYKAITGEPALFAGRKGAASCTTSLYLYESGKYKYLTICFGTKSITGEYQLSGDSIFFLNSSDDFYKYAIYYRKEKYLQLFRSESDTASVHAQFPVLRNELKW